MFDWDEDQESLVALPAPESAGKSVSKTGTSDSAQQLRSRTAMVALGLVFALGFAYEKDGLAVLREQAFTGLPFVASAVPQAVKAELPTGLAVYDAAQARDFLLGVSMTDTATLQAYRSRNKADLAVAGPAFASFHRDAEALLAFELERRLAVPPAPK